MQVYTIYVYMHIYIYIYMCRWGYFSSLRPTHTYSLSQLCLQTHTATHNCKPVSNGTYCLRAVFFQLAGSQLNWLSLELPVKFWLLVVQSLLRPLFVLIKLLLMTAIAVACQRANVLNKKGIIVLLCSSLRLLLRISVWGNVKEIDVHSIEAVEKTKFFF